MPDVKMTVNGQAVSGSIECRTLLVEFIRCDLNLTGTHVAVTPVNAELVLFTLRENLLKLVQCLLWRRTTVMF